MKMAGEKVMEARRVLVTGGTGYIGSHTLVELVALGYHVVVLDNLSNSSFKSLERVNQITMRPDLVSFHQVDLCNYEEFDAFFKGQEKFDHVIHFAALKAVGESVTRPLAYYKNNIMSTLNLLELMEKYGCYSLVFSSSAAVYGAAIAPLSEDSKAGQNIASPYGKTKFMAEEILHDMYNSPSGKKWNIVILRYFNPVGAHPSGLIGEDPNGIPNNLMPFISQVCVGKRPYLTVFGNDYKTHDGTCVRDYLHVVDLAKGHVSAINYIENMGRSSFDIYNLGTGSGLSVLELLHAMEKACGKEIPYIIGGRRAGDLTTIYALADKAARDLKWKAEMGVSEMCEDAWRWQKNNPNGYKVNKED